MEKLRPTNEKLTPIWESLNLIKNLNLNKRMGKAGVLAYLCAVADKDYKIHKSLKEVSAESGVDYGTVQSTFNILYDAEIITPKEYCVYELNYNQLRKYMG